MAQAKRKIHSHASSTEGAFVLRGCRNPFSPCIRASELLYGYKENQGEKFAFSGRNLEAQTMEKQDHKNQNVFHYSGKNASYEQLLNQYC